MIELMARIFAEVWLSTGLRWYNSLLNFIWLVVWNIGDSKNPRTGNPYSPVLHGKTERLKEHCSFDLSFNDLSEYHQNKGSFVGDKP